MDLLLNGNKYEAGIVVVSPLITKASLGLDFMRKHKVTIDLGKAEINIGREDPITIHQHNQSPHVLGSVFLLDSVTLPPLSEIVVMAYSDILTQGETYIIEVKPGKSLACSVAHALVEPRNSKIPIRLLNPKTEAVVIPKHVQVGMIELVNVLLGVVANTSASPVQSDSKLDDFLCSVVEESGAELSEEPKEQFFVLLREFGDVSAQSSSDFGRTSKLEHEIHTGDSTPVRQAVRRVSPHYRQEVEKLLHIMLNEGVVQPSKSPWASPFVLVQKKDNSFRFCIDYRKLNEVTHKDAYPLPRIDDTLNTLAGSKWFSTLDMLSGYWQVQVAEKDRPKTAFCTTEGLFEFKVMPFGLCNAPATFQRLMDLVLAGLQWSHCLVYLDDVIILG